MKFIHLKGMRDFLTHYSPPLIIMSILRFPK